MKKSLLSIFTYGVVLLILLSNTACIDKAKLRATYGEDAGMDSAQTRDGSVMILEGSTSAAPLMEAIVQEFSDKWEIEMTIGDSPAALDDVLTGSADIAIFDNTEIDEDNTENATVLARNNLLLIANKNNPEDDISTDEIIDLLTDQSDEFGNRTNAFLVLPEQDTVSWENIFSLYPIEINYDEGFEVILPESAIICPDDKEIVTAVKKENHAIGIVSSADGLSGVKILNVDSIDPDNVDYPAAVQMLFLANDQNSEFTKAVAEFLGSEKVDQILSEYGFISVK